MSNIVLIGVILGARGTKGEVRMKSFTQKITALFDYGPLMDKFQKVTYSGRITGEKNKLVFVKFDNINTRNEAEALKYQELYVNRDALPKTEKDEYYYSDLIGLDAEIIDGKTIGKVKGIHDIGGGPSLEIDTKDGRTMIPFTKQNVPLVDIEHSRLIISPLDEVLDDQS